MLYKRIRVLSWCRTLIGKDMRDGHLTPTKKGSLLLRLYTNWVLILLENPGLSSFRKEAIWWLMMMALAIYLAASPFSNVPRLILCQSALAQAGPPSLRKHEVNFATLRLTRKILKHASSFQGFTWVKQSWVTKYAHQIKLPERCQLDIKARRTLGSGTRKNLLKGTTKSCCM